MPVLAHGWQTHPKPARFAAHIRFRWNQRFTDAGGGQKPLQHLRVVVFGRGWRQNPGNVAQR